MKTLISILSILLVLSGCQENDDNPDYYQYYPLEIGHQWKYYCEIQYDIDVGPDTIRINSCWTVTDDTVINAEKSFVITRVDSNFNGTICQWKTFYSNRADGLYALGYQNMCSDIAWFKGGDQIYSNSIFNLLFFNNSLKDSVFIPDSSLFLLKYPIEIGNSWRSFEFGPDFDIVRKWVATDTIVTNLGDLKCSKLQIYRDSTDDCPTVNQWINEKGLIKDELFDILYSQTSTGYIHRVTILQEVNF